MKKLLALVVIALSLFSCEKDDTDTNEDTFEIHFKLDGKEYSQVLKKGVTNALVGGNSSDTGYVAAALGASFPLNDKDSAEISFGIGYFQRKMNDLAGNLGRLKQLCRIGPKEYKCLSCDNSGTTEGVDFGFSDFRMNGGTWYSIKWDATTQTFKSITNEQTGSSFVITEVKEGKAMFSRENNGVIIKGTFNCNLYEMRTGAMKVITDGTFTAILWTY